ncbi:MAG: pyridoxine 5'-phosphate synthase [Phycisphaerales bacterium]|nr:pyridoxine 5'-phosphate synthase [Phycisphaerales bacterium]
MPKLSVNIDHVATVRQARRASEPSPLLAAHEAELGGADGITVHLREDRRHIQDDDVRQLRQSIRIPLNFEMAATDEMIEMALRIRPNSVMIVPEGRREITTEGGLDVVALADLLRTAVNRLTNAGIATSVFINAEARQVDAAAMIGVAICEVHTGPFAQSFTPEGTSGEHTAALLERIATIGSLIRDRGMRFNAGHGLNYRNVQAVAALEGVHELHIGHAIVSRAIFVGMQSAVAEMRALCRRSG